MKTLLSISLLLTATVIAHGSDPKPPTSAPAAEVQADGSLLFKAETARVIGYKLHLENKPLPTLVRWVDQRESIEWPQAILHKGKYTVEITYSCPAGAGGGFTIAAAAHKLEAHTEKTADWQTFRTDKLNGTLTVLNDNTTLTLRSSNWIERVLLNFRSIRLTPIADDVAKDKTR